MTPSVSQIVEMLGGTTAVAEELRINKSVVSTWRNRGAIPFPNWDAVKALARKRHKKITFEDLAELLRHPRRADKPSRKYKRRRRDGG